MIWTGTNAAMVYPLFDEDGDFLPEGELVWTDINVVGDATPTTTLWLIFEKEDWFLLDKLFVGRIRTPIWDILGFTTLSIFLQNIWAACEQDAKENAETTCNEWALHTINYIEWMRNDDIFKANVTIRIEEES